MATITVTTLADENDPGAMPGLPYGSGLSLREAIAFANSNPFADTIVFDAALSAGGTITLTNGQLQITDALTIDNGTTPDVTIDAGGLSRVIETSANTTLRGLIITGGAVANGDGGGVLSTGLATLTIEDSVITGNATYGTNANGGGIASGSGAITLKNTTVSNNNTAGDQNKGGGVSSISGTITLENSTVSGNSTSGANSSGGGGVFIRMGNIVLSNSTVSGNSTAGQLSGGGGIAAVNGSITLTNSTVSGNLTNGNYANGGGINMISGTITLTNSIVLGNATSFAGVGDDEIGGTVTQVGPNIIGGVHAFTPAQVFAATGGAAGGGVLANNGGKVQTIALKADVMNPALDAGDDSLDPATDARGLARVDAAGIANNGANISDLGAFELQGTPEPRSLVVTTLSDVADPLDGETSLREAIAFANDPTAGGGTGDADGVNGAVDTITFAPGLAAGGTILLNGTQLSITAPVIIDNGTTPDIVIDAGGLSRVVTTSADTTLKGLTITGGSVAGDGGGVRATGSANLTIEDSVITGNSTSNTNGMGGGISLLTGDLTLTNSTVSDNSTSGNVSSGGGIYNKSGKITLSGSTVSDNSTSGIGSQGGGIAAVTGAITLTDSTVSGNGTTNSNSRGGGIYGYSGNITLTNSTVSDNYTKNTNSAGGGIYGYSATIELTRSTVSGNSTEGIFSDGGGIHSEGGAITLRNSTIAGNSTGGDSSEGGGIYSSGAGGVTLLNSTVTGNTTSGSASEGGGIYGTSGPITLTNSIVLGNATTFAGLGLDDIGGLALVNEGGPNIIGGISGAPAPADVFAAIDGATGGGVLADNGGPVQTVALKASTSNPALDAGNDALAPATDARGEARFDFAGVANNAANISDLGAFELQLVLNVPPSGTNKTVSTSEDVAYTFVLADFGYSDAADPDPDAFAAVRIATLPANGSLQLGGVPVTVGQVVPVASITGGSLKFVPAPNANGAGYASFTFQVRDDGGTASGGVDTDQSPNTITVNVTPVADPPSAPATNSVTTPEDTPSAPVVIGATDPDGDIASYALKPGSGPTTGSVSFSGDSFVYTPGGNFNGPDSFVIRITDSQGNFVEQVVSVTVTPVPDAPTAIDDAVTAISGQTKLIPASDLLANDFDLDGDAISLTGVSNPTGGTVSLSGTTVSFTPTPGFTGQGGFDYTITSVDGSSSARVTVTVTGGAPLNNAPVIAPVAPVKALENTVTIQVQASDPDGDPLTFSATNGANGTVTGGANGLFVYSAAPGFVGSDSFSVTVNDGRGGSASRSVAMTVIDLPDAYDWTIRAPDRHVSEIGGTGFYIGTNGFQQVGVLDLPGLVTFDASIAAVRLARLFVPAGTQTYGPVPGGAGSEVTGTNAAERISLAADANVVLDASFVRGNDTVAILGPSTSYAVSSSVAGIAITSAAGAHIRIPAFGTGGGVTLQFSDVSLPLATLDGTTFTLGGQTITGSPLMIGSALPPVGDSPGTLVYRGGDLIVLPGDAADWCVVETGGAALLSDGDTHVLIPLGAAGVLLSFDDGLRTLARDPHTGSARIGNQTLGDQLVAVTAPDQAIALPVGGDPTVEARLQMNTGGEIAVAGRFHVQGTAGAEQVRLLSGTFDFDASFAQGGDSLRFPDAANTFTAARQGNAALLQGDELSASIPAGQAGTTLYFGQDSRLLVFASGDMLIGTQLITGTASPLTIA